jgi:hypothetical protein
MQCSVCGKPLDPKLMTDPRMQAFIREMQDKPEFGAVSLKCEPCARKSGANIRYL